MKVLRIPFVNISVNDVMQCKKMDVNSKYVNYLYFYFDDSLQITSNAIILVYYIVFYPCRCWLDF